MQNLLSKTAECMPASGDVVFDGESLKGAHVAPQDAHETGRFRAHL